ncbi:flagellar type III secretion system pore protein FliP [Marinivivus vitaminiproducens]|uniref:flagellar type III secretion system pore protein FliP n=1 Tax=Marinivivus vitaminiproducens TaxID=3035935 RepID=UPI002798EBDB|nr:flagellar type III secretion system pore protein FliP [Geminicoccaceae bacterium SCSIO 64248]
MPRSRLGWTALGVLGAVLVGGLPAAAQAQDMIADLGRLAGEGALTGRIVQLFMLITVLSLAPGILMMTTCFPFMVVVLSILRQALGVQQTPPNVMMVSLALFLTFFVMEPVFTQVWQEGVRPFVDGDVTEEQAIERIVEPMRLFMESRVAPDNAGAMMALAGERVEDSGRLPLTALLPAYMITEIERGFEFGFLVFLPFLVIDIVVASILMSMGMMMLPPVMIALPFKLAFFTVSDGWSLIATAMVRSYTGG